MDDREVLMMLTKWEEMGCQMKKNIPTLVGFQPKVLLVGIGGPAPPKFDFKLRRRVREGGKSRGDSGTETVGCQGVSRTENMKRLKKGGKEGR
jgi:hypothetical protein